MLSQNIHTPIVEALIQHNPIAMTVLNRTGEIIDINESASQMLGYDRQSLIGESFLTLIEPDSQQQILQKFEGIVQGELQDSTLLVRHRTGYSFDIGVVSSPLYKNKERIGALLISNDMSDRKRNLERIRYMAYYDDMTGLPNRRSFMMHLDESLVNSQRSGGLIAVLYMDVDRFKLINASFGRDFGDMLLLQVAERLTRGLAENDVVARMEGDEFAMLYRNAGSEKEVLAKTKNIMSILEDPFELQGVPLHMTVSIGVATNIVMEDDASVLIKKADMALGKVKDSGKNDCLLYSEAWDNSSLERLTLQHELKGAIQRGEFVLHYQPQYHLGTGKIVGVEALVRWQHPERGLVPPGFFIPQAEESGMIMQIGDWVLEEACRQNKAWQEDGLRHIPVSVNLSIRQFLQQNLTDKVANILARTGLKAEFLDLEITETMTMDVKHASRCLLDLTKLGVNISIDDFGTGYSSFHYLKNLPIGRLKIDRSFVRDIQQDPGDAAIVAAIIAMAHNLNLQVIAEGVENEVQMQFLQKHMCDEMQGYLWSPPVSGGKIAELLQARQQ
ncbi:EAL domain-containing protein [Paenibacillus oenotherae]|uniref:EAL domain-containing protein n=2 Tax=Paenibacillus oenotherae TaxID=1435645 RepID=A0ABS7DDK4_9BACL|nr:GGDEF domain-containing phosphodiesterase [Paenibacillus oenotherae]MBW7477808.1 EAL domain-containing protein [Paenibacillus oenotherae]